MRRGPALLVLLALAAPVGAGEGPEERLQAALRLEVARGETSEAAARYAALAADPAAPPAVRGRAALRLAACRRALGDERGALEALAAAEALGQTEAGSAPQPAGLDLASARALAAAGRHEEVVLLLEGALEGPGAPTAAVLRGASLLALGQAEQALAAFARARERGGSLAASLWLARTQLALGEPAEALHAASEALAREPDRADAALLQAEALLAHGERDAARAALERALARWPEDAPARLALARLLAAGDEVEGEAARLHLERLLARRASDAAAARLAGAVWTLLGALEAQAAEPALTWPAAAGALRGPDRVAAAERVAVEHERLRRERARRAREALERARARDPRAYEAPLALAALELEAGEPAAALAAARAADALLAAAPRLRLGLWDAQERAWSAADARWLPRRSARARARALAAEAALRAGDLDEAARWTEGLAELDPEGPACWAARARLAAAQERTAAAGEAEAAAWSRAEVRWALALAPDAGRTSGGVATRSPLATAAGSRAAAAALAQARRQALTAEEPLQPDALRAALRALAAAWELEPGDLPARLGAAELAARADRPQLATLLARRALLAGVRPERLERSQPLAPLLTRPELRAVLGR